MTIFPPALLILITACSSDNSVAENLPPNQAEATTLSSQKTNELPDLSKGISREGCDNGPGIYGASSYFLGELHYDQEAVKGEEKWLLYANKKWKEKEGADCSVRWSLSGSISNTTSCGSCDFGVVLHNSLDITGSNCPEDIAKNETGQRIAYDIQLHDDGRADVYFARSGKKLGEGYHKDGTIRYLSAHSCRWF